MLEKEKKGGWAVHHGHVSLVQVPKRDFTFSRAVACFFVQHTNVHLLRDMVYTNIM